MESDIEHVLEGGEHEQDPTSLQLSSKSIQLEHLIELKVDVEIKTKVGTEEKEDGYNEEKDEDELEEKEKNKNVEKRAEEEEVGNKNKNDSNDNANCDKMATTIEIKHNDEEEITANSEGIVTR